MSRGTSYLLLLLILAFCACSKFNKAQKSNDIEFKYKTASDFYIKKDYYRAGVLFEELIPLIRGTEQAEKTQLYYAYCQFYQGQLTMSAYYFKKFSETFPRSEFAEESFFMHCKSLFLDSPGSTLDQTNTYEALNSLQSFFNKYPKSKYLEDCNNMVDQGRRKLENKAYDNARLFHKIGDFKAAVVCYTNFKRDFPDSNLNEESSFYKFQAQHSLAKISIEAKKKDRFLEAMSFYEYFIDTYPKSKYLRQAENLYSNCQEQINQLNKSKVNKS